MERKMYLKEQRKYTLGYLLAAILTLFIYVVTMSSTWNGATIAGVALGAAALQLLIQSKFFLHLKLKERAAWKLYSYVFTWMMLLIVVMGSLWVMMNLNYNMHMTPDQMLQKVKKENTKGF